MSTPGPDEQPVEPLDDQETPRGPDRRFVMPAAFLLLVGVFLLAEILPLSGPTVSEGELRTRGTETDAGSDLVGEPPGTAVPGIVVQGTQVPEATEPERAEPETSETETAEPETTESETGQPETTEPETTEPGDDTPAVIRTVGPEGDYAQLQRALDEAEPGDVIKLIGPEGHRGPVETTNAGTAEKPITLLADPGVTLTCDATVRCLQISHPSYRLRNLTVVGGTSGIYLVGERPGDFVNDVEIKNSTVRGHPDGGTGECIRVKYQAFDIEIANNELIDCGLGECCEDSKNGEGVYIGTAPEQLDANPTDEPDRTRDVWIHHNTIHSLSECVDVKEHSHSILVEYNTCSGQLDPIGAALGSRGGEVGRGNVFRYNNVENAVGACVRLGGDRETDGLGNEVYGNTCRDIGGRVGLNLQRFPQGVICDNLFEGDRPSRLSNESAIDPTTPCPD